MLSRDERSNHLLHFRNELRRLGDTLRVLAGDLQAKFAAIVQERMHEVVRHFVRIVGVGNRSFFHLATLFIFL